MPTWSYNQSERIDAALVRRVAVGFGANERRSRRRRQVQALALCAATLALLALSVQSALGEEDDVGHLLGTVKVVVSPHKLPRTVPAPIALKASFSLKTNDGSNPPPLKSLTLVFENYDQLYTQGLAACRASTLRAQIYPAENERPCHNALVGTGVVNAVVERPENPPFATSGELLIFNGHPVGGTPTVILELLARVPTPTAFITEGVVGQTPFGKSIPFKLPAIVDGDGGFSVTAIDLSIHKRWIFKGKKRSYLLASCPSGKFLMRARLAFANGATLVGEPSKDCTSIRLRRTLDP
jgi:hypothetical protein